MSRKRKKKRSLPPRCQRMNRSARLQSAVSWLKKYNGKNILRGYCKHFAVDWRCAAIELRQLGITLNEQHFSRRAETELARRRRKGSQTTTETNSDWPPYESSFDAYLAGDYAAHYALEQENSAREQFVINSPEIEF